MKRKVKIVKTIDLWTEQYPKNHELECIKGAFIDGFESQGLPYDSIEIIKNCNCVISNNANLDISNKHNAVIFYKNNNPVRLLVFNYQGDFDKLLSEILKQNIGCTSLKEIFDKNLISINSTLLNGNYEQNIKPEIDVGSCDNFDLLQSLLGSSYTIDKTGLGNNSNPDFDFNSYTQIEYILKTEHYLFNIEHQGAYINKKKDRIIPIQAEGKIKLDKIKKN